jgi:acyl dehydratase
VSDADLVATLRGQRFGPSAWRTVTQEQIDAFAEMTGDHNWLHVDVERARREGPYGETIAHGNLTLSLVDGFRDELLSLRQYPLGVNYGYDRVRWPAPVRAGAQVRATVEITAVEPLPDGWFSVVQRFVIDCEGEDKPACVADSLIRVRPAG